MSSDSEELTPGALLAGRYEIRELLGSAPAWQRYRALDGDVDLEVELWRFQPELWPGSRDRERLLRAIAAMRRIDHPYLLRLFNTGESGGTVYATTQLCQGVVLPREPAEFLPYARIIAEALEAAHAAGKVHSRLAPSDVVDVGGAIKVRGAGLYSDLDPTAARRYFRETSRYLAPEIKSGDRATPAADVYSLGAIFAICTVGSAAIDLQSALEFIKAKKRSLHRVLTQALSVGLHERPRSPGALVEAAADALGIDRVAGRAADPIDGQATIKNPIPRPGRATQKPSHPPVQPQVDEEAATEDYLEAEPIPAEDADEATVKVSMSDTRAPPDSPPQSIASAPWLHQGFGESSPGAAGAGKRAAETATNQPHSGADDALQTAKLSTTAPGTATGKMRMHGQARGAADMADPPLRDTVVDKRGHPAGLEPPPVRPNIPSLTEIEPIGPEPGGSIHRRRAPRDPAADAPVVAPSHGSSAARSSSRASRHRGREIGTHEDIPTSLKSPSAPHSAAVLPPYSDDRMAGRAAAPLGQNLASHSLPGHPGDPIDVEEDMLPTELDYPAIPGSARGDLQHSSREVPSVVAHSHTGHQGHRPAPGQVPAPADSMSEQAAEYPVLRTPKRGTRHEAPAASAPAERAVDRTADRAVEHAGGRPIDHIPGRLDMRSQMHPSGQKSHPRSARAAEPGHHAVPIRPVSRGSRRSVFVATIILAALAGVAIAAFLATTLW
ncbi:MAG: protein kinase [Proteobacteria bacterium]|nr:protein kinase [Pseudomonadota bacterium]